MQVTVTTRHINDKNQNKMLKDYAIKKANRLERYINEEKDPSEVKIILSCEKFRNMAEILVNDGRVKVNASVEMDEMHAAIDGVMDIIIKQLRRKSDKKIRTKRRANSKPAEIAEIKRNINNENSSNNIHREQLDSKPMSVEEAKLQLDVAEKGFIVFRNTDTGEMNVLYRKRDSKAGLITP